MLFVFPFLELIEFFCFLLSSALFNSLMPCSLYTTQAQHQQGRYLSDALSCSSLNQSSSLRLQHLVYNQRVVRIPISFVPNHKY